MICNGCFICILQCCVCVQVTKEREKEISDDEAEDEEKEEKKDEDNEEKEVSDSLSVLGQQDSEVNLSLSLPPCSSLPGRTQAGGRERR